MAWCPRPGREDGHELPKWRHGRRLQLATQSSFLAGIGFGLSLLLSGCAQPTPYQPATDGYGYADQQIEQNRYRVSFAGNMVTPRDTVQNFLLLRAAELTQATGNDHFIVVDRGLERSTSYHGTGFGTGLGSGVGWADDGWTGFGTSTYSAYPVDSYTAFADIVVGKGPKPAGDVDAYDARDVQARLGPTAVRPAPAVRPAQ